jgi:hypothetical protein
MLGGGQLALQLCRAIGQRLLLGAQVAFVRDEVFQLAVDQRLALGEAAFEIEEFLAAGGE